jgi:phage baseplate assembly protein V
MSNGRDDLPPSWHQEEHERRLDQLIQVGKVTAAKIEGGQQLVRVAVGSGAESGWVPAAQARAGKDGVWHALSVGEQVALFAPGGAPEGGFVWGSIPHNAHPGVGDADTVTVLINAEDGSRVSYDKSAHSVKIGAGELTMTQDTFSLKVGGCELTMEGGVLVLKGSQVKTDGETILNGGTREAAYKTGTVTGGVIMDGAAGVKV